MASTPLSATLLPPLPKFNGTCVPVQYPCYPGTRYIDPCDCKFYFLCRNTGSIVRLSCSTGTAYDHTSSQSFCQRMRDVVGRGKCDHKLPWKRCQDQYGASADLQKLQSWCTSSGYLTPVPPRRGREEDTNAGAIAAVVILLLLLAIVVVLIVVYVRKKGNPLPKLKKTTCWQNLVWCWREVICCESDGAGYYYDDDDDGGENNDDVERQHGAGGNNDDDEDGRRRSSLPPRPMMNSDGTRSSIRRGSVRGSQGKGKMTKEQEAEEGSTYHDFGGDMMERRMSSRRSQAAIAEEELEDPDHHAAQAMHAVYDNPAFDPNAIPTDDDDDDTPPPDTEYSPAPPAYSHGDGVAGWKPGSARRSARHHSLGLPDAELIEASFEEEGAVAFTVGPPPPSMNRPLTARSTRSQSTPAFHFRGGGDADGNSSDGSYTMA